MKNQKLERMLKEYEAPEKFAELEDGVKKLLSFYYWSKQEDNKSNMLVVKEIIWDSEIESFVNGLKKYGVKELVFASTWSSAIETMMYFLENGYQVDGTVVYRDETLFGHRDIKKGIKLILK